MIVNFKCPCCERKLRGVSLMAAATLIVKRTCTCRKRWQVKIAPIRSKGGMHFHAVDFIELGVVA